MEVLPALAYRLNPRVQLHWRQFGNDWILFEALSGQMHQMSRVTAAVLMCYETGHALTEGDLQVMLRLDFEVVMPAAQTALPGAVADQLQGLGLLIPARVASSYAAV